MALSFDGFQGYLCKRVKPGHELVKPNPPTELFVSQTPLVKQTASGLILDAPPECVAVIYFDGVRYMMLAPKEPIEGPKGDNPA